LLIVPHTPPKERNSTWLKTWLGDACNALDAIVTDVNQDVTSPSRALPPASQSIDHAAGTEEEWREEAKGLRRR